MNNPFTTHPATVGETYLQHMGMAFGFSRRMFVASVACFIHGVFPFLCVRFGSKVIRGLNETMVKSRRKQPYIMPDGEDIGHWVI